MDSESGQYISQDPIGLAGDKLTLYSYVSDTLYAIDYFGLKGCKLKKADPDADHDYLLTISRKQYPETAKHIDDAITSGKPSIVTKHGSKRKSRKNRRKSLKGIPTKPNKDRDEWPMAMFKEGGEGASVRHIDPSDNRGAGSSIGNELRSLPKGTRIKFEIVD